MVDSTAAAPADKELPPTRDKIIEALLSLAKTSTWRDIDITAIANEADVSLVDFRDAFPSKGAVFAAFWRRIDREVLSSSPKSDGENHRERLFDIYMRRLDLVAPYKTALKNILQQLCREPLTLAALNRQELNSQRFMLAAAGIRSEGALGHWRQQGAVALFAKTMEVWLRDESTGLDKTMAFLDRELHRAETINEKAMNIRHIIAPLCSIGGAFLDFGNRLARCRSRHKEDKGHDPAAAI